MNMFHKHLLAASLVAGLGLSAAFAQSPPAGGRHDPARHEQRMAKKQERHAQKLAELKAKLQIHAAQETAWNAWVAAMQRPARGQRPDFAAMTTPQRIDYMRARRAERAAAMDQRAEVTKSFYGVLSAAQQKVFDAETLRMGKGHRGHRGHHG
jgi:periplasmic protein CpxP/Spy